MTTLFCDQTRPRLPQSNPRIKQARECPPLAATTTHPRPLLQDRAEPLKDALLQLAVLGQVDHVAGRLDVVGEDVVLAPLLLLRGVPEETNGGAAGENIAQVLVR